MIPAFLLWTVIGLVLGLIGSQLINLRGDDPRLSIAVSIIAAIVGGIVHRMFSDATTSMWTSVWSYLMPALFAAAALVVWHIVRTRGAYKHPTFRQSY